jgi:hypothetical protein
MPEVQKTLLTLICIFCGAACACGIGYEFTKNKKNDVFFRLFGLFTLLAVVTMCMFIANL